MRFPTLALCTLSLALFACSSSDDEPSGPAEKTPPEQTTSDPTPKGSSPEDTTSNSGNTSLGTPAACTTDADCPAGIACVTFVDPTTGQEGPGHCDVNEHSATPTDPGGTSLATPAMCETAADCPDGVDCVSFDDGPGFCNVTEMTAE